MATFKRFFCPRGKLCTSTDLMGIRLLLILLFESTKSLGCDSLPRKVLEMYSDTWLPERLISERCVSSRFSILLNWEGKNRETKMAFFSSTLRQLEHHRQAVKQAEFWRCLERSQSHMVSFRYCSATSMTRYFLSLPLCSQIRLLQR